MAGLSEGRLDRKKVYLRIPIELCRKVLRQYGDGSGDGEAKQEDYFRAMRAAIGDVTLTDDDKRQMDEIVARNKEQRMAERQAHKAKKAAVRSARRDAGGVS